MEDFTLVHFLDRFVFKNPKKEKKDAKSMIFSKRFLVQFESIIFEAFYFLIDKKSVFEPVKSFHKSGIKNLPINSKEYLNLDKKKIPVEEKIFYE
jgi:hypothetical protein